MAVTDQQVLTEIQEHLVEVPNAGASWPSELWTVAEVIGYLNKRQYDFVKQTKLLMNRVAVATTPNEVRQPLPPDWIATQRVVLRRLVAPLYVEIPRSDTFEDDALLGSAWEYNQDFNYPRTYTDGEASSLEIIVAPPMNNVGELQILYVALSTLLSNSGVLFTVPDEFTPAIKWGVISDMLNKITRANNPTRAKYAESRYQEGIAAAKVMLEGWL